MSRDALVSIVICTCNRSASLKRTLEILGQVRVPAGWQAELIVVDNGSADDTVAVVKNAVVPQMNVRCVPEPQRGLCFARNAGLASAGGDVILFTDDDVMVSADWLEQMLKAFETSRADAVVGKIELAVNLERPWMNRHHRWWLAAPDHHPAGLVELVGANMGFRRGVLQQVVSFDTELDAGRLGFGGEALFSQQLSAAGFTIHYAPEAVVVHQPDESRLLRRAWVTTAGKKGQSDAYLRYHWSHDEPAWPRIKWFWFWLKLRLRRLVQPPPPLDTEGGPTWETYYVRRLEMYRQFCIERKRPRNYARRGLAKLNHLG